MLFQTTDDRVKKLEKRVDEMEKNMSKTLMGINDAFTTITDVITKLQQENESLKKEKNIILSRQKQIAKGIKETGIKRDIKSSIIEPVKSAVAENFEFIREVAREDFAEKPGIKKLLDLVENEKETSFRDAAEKMGVHELQIGHWASRLKDQKLITVAEKKNKKYLCSVKQAKTDKGAYYET